jgi:hypothetical protein
VDPILILLILIAIAILLSLISIIMMVVFLLRTNARIKNIVKNFKLFFINNWVDKNMKKHDSQYGNIEAFLNDTILKKQ